MYEFQLQRRLVGGSLTSAETRRRIYSGVKMRAAQRWGPAFSEPLRSFSTPFPAKQ